MHDPTVFAQALHQEGLTIRALMRPYWLNIICGLLLLLVTNLIIVMLPLLINQGISLIESKPYEALQFFYWRINFSNAMHVVIALIILAILVAIIRTLSRVVLFDVGRCIEKDIRALVFNRICVMDDDFLSRHRVGDIMNHLTSDVTNVRLLTGFAALNIMNIFIMFIFTIPLLFRIDIILACCALLPFPLVMLAMNGLTKKMFETTKYYQEHLGYLVNHIQENLLGAHVVRLFHQQEAETARFSQTNNKTYDAGLKLAKVRMLIVPLMRLVIGLAVGLILFLGGYALIIGRISLGDFVEINARILQLTWPAMSVGFVMSMFSRGQASIERINKLITPMPLIYDGLHELENLTCLRVHNLKINTHAKSVSFSLCKNQTLGVVGMSGSYKSTLLKILYRRNPVDSGLIFYNNHDINNIKLESFYKFIAVVTQDPILFHQSIRQNICFARPDAPEHEIQHVLRITKLSDDIKYAPHGLDTIIGERGITLSGGQRQRVALARALLVRPQLLILDDALSAVDAATEQHIIHEINNYVKDCMIIIATHRLAALKNAHEILVLDQGSILARGCHRVLLESCALYRELWGQND